jgi:ribosomal protein S12 methylthiotransferase
MKINLISLGCPKNLVDSEKILGALGAAGIFICALPQDSDIIIINTCGFIKPALEETEDEIEKALQVADGSNKKVYVLGCAVNRYENELKDKYPMISGWFKLEDKKKLLHAIKAEAANIESRLPTTQGYAYLKIADGCSNHCSYCTIPLIKGKYYSFDMDKLVKEAIELSKLGIKEIILIAQDTTRYGLDIYNKPMLVPLIKNISKIPGIEWIRIMYAHPKSIDDKIIDEIESNKKICKYIDLPIQHINNRILQLMNRGVSRKRIKAIIKKLKNIKGISLRTTVIIGFPTETNEEFKELIEFLKEADFDWLGVFPYFKESGTKAAHLENVPDSIIDSRYKRILNLQKDLIKRKNTERIGNIYKTLIHSQNGYYIGHTEFTAPEIDNHVLIDIGNLKIGDFYNLKITNAKGCDLYANTEG